MWLRSFVVCSVLIAGTTPWLVSCASKKSTLATTAPAVAPVVAAIAATIAGPTLATTRPADLPGLHNVVAYADGIYSGAVPEGKEGFETLKHMGIKSIISVDGAAPDVALARAEGLTYVHLPITYGGISDERRLELAQAVKALPKPIYIHCHHGKHRSAAAAAVAMVGLGELTPEQATERMKVSGTAPSYAGLYQCVNLATIVSVDELSKPHEAFPEVWKTSGMVNAMVEIDEVFDRLKLIEKTGWKAPADHPDLVPAAEAGHLADLMRVVKDDHEVLNRPQELGDWLQASSDQATELEQALTAGTIDPKFASAKFASVTQSCKTCHVKYRD
jgi:protein tyrosine phosphatase (PTP) superfamily phosphohydrolase (DUF442 family)/cytochrome c556